MSSSILMKTKFKETNQKKKSLENKSQCDINNDNRASKDHKAALRSDKNIDKEGKNEGASVYH